MLDRERLKLFDQLRSELEREVASIESTNLDKLVPSYTRAIELHAQCLKILQETELQSIPATQREWQGFKETKSRIEELDAQLSSECSLHDLVFAYLELRDLILQYQEQLETVQNLIEVQDKSSDTDV